MFSYLCYRKAQILSYTTIPYYHITIYSIFDIFCIFFLFETLSTILFLFHCINQMQTLQKMLLFQSFFRNTLMFQPPEVKMGHPLILME